MMEQPALLARFEGVRDAPPATWRVAREGQRTLSGYRLEVSCPCSVIFERWVFPEDAAIDLALIARWN